MIEIIKSNNKDTFNFEIIKKWENKFDGGSRQTLLIRVKENK